jgi:hypothetical protein
MPETGNPSSEIREDALLTARYALGNVITPSVAPTLASQE